jgi:hypothetical protein
MLLRASGNLNINQQALSKIKVVAREVEVVAVKDNVVVVDHGRYS